MEEPHAQVDIGYQSSQVSVSDFMCRPDIAITHAPGCMFVTDIANESLSLS